MKDICITSVFENVDNLDISMTCAICGEEPEIWYTHILGHGMRDNAFSHEPEYNCKACQELIATKTPGTESGWVHIHQIVRVLR